MKTLLTLAFVALAAPAYAATSKTQIVAACQSVDVPESVMPQCIKDMQACTKSKSLDRCEAELFSPDQ